MDFKKVFSLVVFLSFGFLSMAQSAEQEVSPIDKIQFWDGNNNYYVVLPYKINYSPMTSENSSSGFYNGGSAKSNSINESEFDKLSKSVKKIYDDEDLRIEQRQKGSVKLQIEHENGLVEYVYIKSGKEAKKLEQMMKKKLK